MFFRPALRKVVSELEIRDAARDLKPRILEFAPDTVVYIEEGGKTFGLAIAEELGVPAMGIDIGYPMSPVLNSLPRVIKILAWPVKEIVYKCLSPKLRSTYGTKNLGRIILVDDSASTGRSIEVALAALEARGVDRSSVRVAVFRCGAKARSCVDFFETEEPVLFIGR